MAANEAKIIVVADDKASPTLTGIGEKAKSMRGAFLAVGAAGAAVTGAIALSIKSFAQAGDEIQKMALRTGLGTEALSELKFALEQSGSNIEGFEKGIRRMSSFIQDGRDGLTETTRALDSLGIAVSDFDGMSPEAAFDTLSTALAGVEDDLAQAALAQDIFGRSGTALLPLLKQGKDGIEALKQEAHDLGIVFDQDAADSAARLVDAQNTLNKSFQGVQFALAEGVAPALSGALEKMSVIISKVTDFAKENPVLTKTIVALAAGLGTLAVAVAGIGLVLPIMATGLGFVTAGFIGLNVATGGIIIAIGALAAGIVLLIQNWDAVVRAVKIGANALITAFEFFFKEVLLFNVNNAIRAFNLLAGVFGKKIDLIEIDIKRFDTSVEKSAEVVDESSKQMAQSLGVVQDEFTETADVAEDAYERMSAIIQAQNAAGLQDALTHAENIISASNDRYAKLKEQRWQNVEDEAAANAQILSEEEEFNNKRLAGIESFWTLKAAKSKEEFDRLADQMMALPSVIPSGGVGTDLSGGDSVANAMRAFKDSQNKVSAAADIANAELRRLEALTTVKDGEYKFVHPQDLIRLEAARAEAERLAKIMHSDNFKGATLGQMVLDARGHVLGGAPPMLPGMKAPERFVRGEEGMQKERLGQGGWTVIFEGDVYGMDDFDEKVVSALTNNANAAGAVQ